MVDATCDYCGAEVEKEGGGILLSPPDGKITIKDHICQKCYEKLKPDALKLNKVVTKGFIKQKIIEFVGRNRRNEFMSPEWTTEAILNELKKELVGG